MGKRESGFSLFELVLVIVLVMILFLTIGLRLLPMRGDAEAAHVEQVLGSIRSGLGMAVAKLAVADGLSSLSELEGANPLVFLSRAPAKNAGPLMGPLRPPPGAWGFRPESGRLLYSVRYPQYLEGAPEGPVLLRWRIEVSDDGRPHVLLVPEPGQPGWLKPDRAPFTQRDPERS